MTDKKEETKAPKASPKTAPTKAPSVFPASELKEHSRELFGVKPYVFAGAFHKKEDGLVTIKEAETVIRNYLKGKGVKR